MSTQDLVNSSFENSIISSALKYEHCFSELRMRYIDNKVIDEVFTLGINKDIFKFLVESPYLISKEQLVYDFKSKLEGADRDVKVARLDFYYETKTQDNLNDFCYMLDELRRLYARRELQVTCSNILTAPKEKHVQSLLDEGRKNIFKLDDFMTDRYKIERRNVLDIEPLKDDLVERIEKPELKLKANFFIKEVDEATGGIDSSEMVTFLADTGVGKSITLSHIACNNWFFNKLNVVHFSLEMPLAQCQYRAHANLFEIMYKKFKRADFKHFEINEWEKHVQEFKESHDNFFEIVAGSGFNAMKVEEECNRFQDKHKKEVDLVTFDYMNIATDNKSRAGSTRQWEAQGDIVWEFKDFAGEYNSRRGVRLFTGNQLGGEKNTSGRVGLNQAMNIIIGMEQWKELEIKDEISWRLLKTRDSEKSMDELILPSNFDYMSVDKRIQKIKRERKLIATDN